MRVRFDDERGIAMYMAITVSFVVLLLSLVAVQISVHGLNQGSYDRDRTQAIDAAEAGIDSGVSTIQTSTPTALPCTNDGNLTTTPTAHYHVVFSYYPKYPISGSPMTCPIAAHSLPGAAMLMSTGSAGTRPSAARTMQTELRLRPTFSGLTKAIFANSSISVGNNFTLNGFTGSDADLYTNGDWTCNNNAVLQGSVSSQGAVNMSSSCAVTQDVLANGAVSLRNSSNVGHNAVSSTSSVSLSQTAHVYKDATAGTSCSGCNASSVSGTITTNHPSSAPPAYTFPTINYVATDWQAAGYDTSHTFSDCTAAQNFINDVGSATPTVVRITPACALSWNGGTINVRGDLAIITDGSITTTNNTSFVSADGQIHQIMFIVPTSAATTCTGGPHDISISNLTTFDANLRTFWFTPCTATFANNNNGLGGQVYAGNLSVTNQFLLSYIPILIPGITGASGYNADIAYLREIPNP